ncbi:MAG: hypothetical protein K2J20_04425, partial [Bacilli bacterium]|nr:hypothetical protein [Bacilli bacterium]
PRKINSLIKDEFLDGIPSFRYKKVNIFIGSNASGKTSLCKAIWGVLGFLIFKEKQAIEVLLSNASLESLIEMDFVEKLDEEYNFFRLKIKYSPANQGSNSSIKISYNKIILKNGDTYESVCKCLERIGDSFMDYLEVLKCLDFGFGYNIILPFTEPAFNRIVFLELQNEQESEDYEKVLNAVFKTLDPSILSVKQSKESNDAYVINYQNGKIIIVQNGMTMSDIPYLSSGTKYGFNIANMICSIKNHMYGIYAIDEQFSYTTSDIEIAALSTMISLLGPAEQLFFTTHNTNILSIGLPFHSFYFMRKKLVEDKQVITVTCGSEKENRNNVSPKNLYDNDVFGTAPIVDLILDLGEEDAE